MGNQGVSEAQEPSNTQEVAAPPHPRMVVQQTGECSNVVSYCAQLAHCVPKMCAGECEGTFRAELLQHYMDEGDDTETAQQKVQDAMTGKKTRVKTKSQQTKSRSKSPAKTPQEQALTCSTL